MKFPKCKYWDKISGCCAPKGAHTFDEGCKGHRSNCPAYVRMSQSWWHDKLDLAIKKIHDQNL